MPVRIEAVELAPDPRRVIARPLASGAYRSPDDRLVDRVLALTDQEVTAALARVDARFADRHADLDAVLREHYEFAVRGFPDLGAPSTDRRRLIGAYYTQEHSIEATAFTNPSIVPAPDQSGLAPGEQRFVMSLRAIGEGHLSSVEFRTGLIGATGDVSVEAPARTAVTGAHRSTLLDRGEFCSKLIEMDAFDVVAERVVEMLPGRFELGQLETVIADVEGTRVATRPANPTTRAMHWLAKSNYELTFPSSTQLSERVIFPWLAIESHGLEDARFVRFVDDDGSVSYYATYTAYDGSRVLPQLIETHDFATFRVGTLSGRCAANKGAALFPRRIGGCYVALSRFDAENTYVMSSDMLQVWDRAELVDTPSEVWELARVGNCGSPIETPEGWLVITHGVGPFREYSLGAMLLGLDDPCRVIGRLPGPLLGPADTQRDGYVPNVVYSCGSMVHGDELVVPFGTADTSCRIARIELSVLLDRLVG